MKILHVIPHYFPSPYFGGTPVVCHNIAHELAVRGHAVDVLTTDVYSNTRRVNSQDLTDEDTQLYTIVRKRNLSNWLAFHFKMSNSPGAYTYFRLRSKEYEVIHLHEYRTILNVIAALNKPQNSKMILHPQGTFENFNSRQLLKKIFDFFFARLILSKCDHIIALSSKERELLLTAGVDSKIISVMHNAVHHLDDNDYQLKMELPSKYILYLGRINRIKNLELLINSYNRSDAPKRNINLLIAGGDDGYLSEMLKAIEKHSHISYIGPLTNTQKSTVISKALFVAYVTLNEPWGLVPLEAACLGIPSLISSDAGVSELITKYRLGKLVDPYVEDDVSSGINSMITNPIKISNKTVKELKTNLSWKKYTDRLLELYQT